MRIGQTVGHQRCGAFARMVSTDVGQSNPRFDIRPFLRYPFAGGTTFSRPGLIGRYNLALGHLADKGDLTGCLRLAAQMKVQGVKPDILTYNCLIRASGRDALAMQATAIFEDMLAIDLQPERETFHLLLKVCPSACINPGFSADFRIGSFATAVEDGVVALE